MSEEAEMAVSGQSSNEQIPTQRVANGFIGVGLLVAVVSAFALNIWLLLFSLVVVLVAVVGKAISRPRTASELTIGEGLLFVGIFVTWFMLAGFGVLPSQLAGASAGLAMGVVAILRHVRSLRAKRKPSAAPN